MLHLIESSFCPHGLPFLCLQGNACINALADNGVPFTCPLVSAALVSWKTGPLLCNVNVFFPQSCKERNKVCLTRLNCSNLLVLIFLSYQLLWSQLQDTNVKSTQSWRDYNLKGQIFKPNLKQEIKGCLRALMRPLWQEQLPQCFCRWNSNIYLKTSQLLGEHRLVGAKCCPPSSLGNILKEAVDTDKLIWAKPEGVHEDAASLCHGMGICTEAEGYSEFSVMHRSKS